MVIMASTGWPCCARLLAGQACGLPAFPVPRGRSGLRGQGRPAGPSRAGRCAAPWRPEGRPRTLSGRRRPAAAQPPPLPGPRSGPAAVTRRPFPPATARNPPGCACRAPNAGGHGCNPRSMPPPRPARPPWWRTAQRPQLELQRRVPRLDDRVVQRRPGPAHRLGDLEPLARGPEAARGVLAALIGVEHHAGHRAAPDGHRHRQRAVGQRRVVTGAEREPDDPARAHVQHESRYSLPSPVTISVPSPYQRRLIPPAANFRFT